MPFLLNQLIQQCQRLFLKYKNGITVTSIFLFILALVQFECSEQKPSDYLSLCGVIPMVLVLLLLIINFLPRSQPPFLRKNTNGIDLDQFSAQHIRPDKENPGDIHYTPMVFDAETIKRFQFVDNDQLALLSGEINYLLFRHSQWAGAGWRSRDRELLALKKKIERNRKHAEQYDRSLILLKDKEANLAGFTHIFPVTANTWGRYLNGDISDLNFPYDGIANTKKDAHGIIIFSIGSLESTDYRQIPNSLKLHISDELNDALYNIYQLKKDNKYNVIHLRNIYRAVLYHVNEIIARDFTDKTEIPVLVQVEDRGLRKILERNNFKKHDKLSRDGCEIFVAWLKIRPKLALNKLA